MENRSQDRCGRIPRVGSECWASRVQPNPRADEIEERPEDGVLETLGGLLLTFRTSVQEGENVIGSDGTDFPVTELVIEFVQEKAVILDGIFFPS